MNTLYPAGPANVPKDFTQPTAQYRWQVTLVLVSLVLSLALYLVLVAGSAWLCYLLVTAPWPMRAGGGYVFLRIVAILCSGLLSLYLVKGLFKGSHQDQTLLLEVTEADQPELFGFIRQICAETGAPFPHKVYLSPEVNAAVFYQSSFHKAVVNDLGAAQDSIDPIWIQHFLAQTAEIQDKLRRLLFKSTGAILLLQEQIRQQHPSNAPAVQLESMADPGFET